LIVLNSAGRWALMVGAVSFAIFWGMSLFAIDGPWALTLGLHGLSIVSIAFGLIRQYQSSTESRNPLLNWIGVALTIIGTFASSLILALGLTTLAISLWTNDQRRLSPVLVIGGLQPSLLPTDSGLASAPKMLQIQLCSPGFSSESEYS
jgi:hypothetical protein